MNKLKSLKEMTDSYYMDYEGWELEWLSGNTEWWPDSIPLLFSYNALNDECLPGVDLPATALAKLMEYKSKNETYITHVDRGVHAYRIGVVSEYKIKHR